MTNQVFGELVKDFWFVLSYDLTEKGFAIDLNQGMVVKWVEMQWQFEIYRAE
jgi:hypothetical protein